MGSTITTPKDESLPVNKEGRMIRSDDKTRKKLVYDKVLENKTDASSETSIEAAAAATSLLDLYKSPHRPSSGRDGKSTPMEGTSKKFIMSGQLLGTPRTSMIGIATTAVAAATTATTTSTPTPPTSTPKPKPKPTVKPSSDSDSDESSKLLPSPSKRKKQLYLDSDDEEGCDVDSPGFLSSNIYRYSINGTVYHGHLTFSHNTKYNRISIVSTPGAKVSKKQRQHKLFVEKTDRLMEVKYSMASSFPHILEENNIIDSFMVFKVHARHVQGGDSLLPPIKLPRTGASVLVVEFSREAFLRKLIKSQTLCPFEIKTFEVFKMMAGSLLEHANTDLKARNSGGSNTKTPAKLKGVRDEETLFYYPFPATTDTQNYERVCDDLMELQSQSKGCNIIENRRQHLVDVRLCDLKRLGPGVWLNCNLINLWLLWITRDQPQDFVVLNSYFYTKLSQSGPEELENWFDRSSINIFKKRMIFIPICKNFHWSLCVLVNLGAFSDDPIYEKLSPSFIYLDSAGGGSRDRVERKIIEMINWEWSRLYPAKIMNSKALRRFSPKVPQQENGYDCGVYTLKYAFQTYQLKSALIEHSFSACNTKGFLDMFESSTSDFNFNAKDITRIRKQFSRMIRDISLVSRMQKKDSVPKKYKDGKKQQTPELSKPHNVKSPPSSKASKPLAKSTGTSKSSFPLEPVDHNVVPNENSGSNYKSVQSDKMLKQAPSSNDAKTVNWPANQSNLEQKRYQRHEGTNHKHGFDVQAFDTEEMQGAYQHSVYGSSSTRERHTVSAEPNRNVSKSTNYSKRHLDPGYIGSSTSDLDNQIPDDVWIHMDELAKISYVLNCMSSLSLGTNYAKPYLDPQIICNIIADLDKRIPDTIWVHMDDLARISYVLSRIRSAKYIDVQQKAQYHRPSGSELHHKFEGRQQQSYQSTKMKAPTAIGVASREGRIPIGTTAKHSNYITFSAPTPQRTILAKEYGNVTKSRIKKSDRWVANLNAKSQNPNVERGNGDVEDKKLMPNSSGTKRKRKIPNRISAVFNTSNKKKLLRDGDIFMNRHNIDMHCEPLWPQTHAVYMVFNEIKRNSAGNSKAKSSTVKRDKTQLNFLGSSEKAIEDFKEIFPLDNVDHEKYDVSFTVEPKEWVGRLGEEDGEQLVRGAGAEAMDIYQDIKEVENTSDFTPRR